MINHAKAIVPLAMLVLLVTLGSSSAAQQATAAATPSSSPTHLRVSPDVAQKNIITKVPPHYPLKAKKRHIAGDVLLGYTISRKGKVEDLKVVSGDPILARAASDAVRRWKYRPFLLNGEPVEVETTTKIIFRM